MTYCHWFGKREDVKEEPNRCELIWTVLGHIMPKIGTAAFLDENMKRLLTNNNPGVKFAAVPVRSRF